MKKHRRGLLFIFMALMITAAAPAAAHASESELTVETEQMAESEQTVETEQMAESEQIAETEQNAETEELTESEDNSATVAAQEQTDAPAVYSVQVSASINGDSLMITISDGTPAVDCLMVTLPGGETQILNADAGNTQFLLTVDKSLQGKTISYIPGTAGETEITWYSALGGNFAIPQLETTVTVDTAGESDAEDTSGDSDSEDTAADSNTEESASDMVQEEIVSEAKTQKSKTGKKAGAETTGESENALQSESDEASSESDEASSGSEETSSKSGKSSSGSKKTSSGTGKGKSSSGSKGKSGNSETEESETVTEARSALGIFLLDSGKTLIYSPDEAPALEGMTYEATWKGEGGIRIYLYEENGAILELSPESTETGTGEETGEETDEGSAADSGNTSLRFLLIPEREDSDSASRMWQQILETAASFSA